MGGRFQVISCNDTEICQTDVVWIEPFSKRIWVKFKSETTDSCLRRDGLSSAPKTPEEIKV